MTGRALFNEVFFDDAIVDDADLIGGVNNGWAVANTTLLFERTGIGAGGGGGGFPPPGTKGGFLGMRARATRRRSRRPRKVGGWWSRSSSTSPGGTTAPVTHTCARSSRR